MADAAPSAWMWAAAAADPSPTAWRCSSDNSRRPPCACRVVWSEVERSAVLHAAEAAEHVLEDAAAAVVGEGRWVVAMVLMLVQQRPDLQAEVVQL